MDEKSVLAGLTSLRHLTAVICSKLSDVVACWVSAVVAVAFKQYLPFSVIAGRLIRYPSRCRVISSYNSKQAYNPHFLIVEIMTVFKYTYVCSF